MQQALEVLERQHRLVILALVGVIGFFAIACTFNNAIPICHYIFGCDHWFHASAAEAGVCSTVVNLKCQLLSESLTVLP